MTGLKWKLEDDDKTATITFPTAPPVTLNLGAVEIEDMLKNLGALRSKMKPEIPRKFASGQKVEAILDPAWLTEPDAMKGDSIIHMRDSRFGWLHYLIPKEKAKKLATFLQNQASAPPFGHRPNKVN